jgi:glycine dehydrogenase
MHVRQPDLDLSQDFSRRHIGPNPEETAEMLRTVGFDNLDALIDATVPKNIRLDRELNLP